MRDPDVLHARGLSIDSPGGRPLFRELSISLGAGERVALVGRNGVGKSSLLQVLAGDTPPEEGRVTCRGTRRLVSQQPDSVVRDAASPGEVRKNALQEAREARSDLLLLDEPTHDLDPDNVEWLLGWLAAWRGALIVVSHDRRLLRTFGEFFVVAESGCRHFRGTFDGLLAELERDREDKDRRYVRNLRRLLDDEKRNATVRRRRQRKKNLGRLHELGRCPSRGRLNENRAYAQESQGKRAVLQKVRIGAARDWVRATRRALSVDLPLELALPSLPDDTGEPIAVLEEVGARAGGRSLFERLSLRVGRRRIAIVGRNGSGKSTLVEILTGQRRPDSGRVVCDPIRIGYVAQKSRNWCLDTSVVERLVDGAGASPETVAVVLRAHRFPLALADRPLKTLSPGERLRAALICLCQRRPAPELLVLDEPTDEMDFLGAAALQAVLAAWGGGLVVVSHDPEFLEAIGVEERYALPDPRAGGVRASADG